MAPQGRSRDIEPPRDRRQGSKAGRPGKPMPGLPIRGRHLGARTPIWLLALCIVVALILRATSAAEAQERRPDWLPDALELPDDIEVAADRRIGATIRMLTLQTSADVHDLMIEWEEALRANGYAVGRGRDEPLDGIIEFSGTAIVNAKIIVSPGNVERRGVIEIDATLR